MALNDGSFGIGNYYLLWSQTVALIMGQLSGRETGVEIAGPVDDSSPDRLWVTFSLGEGLLGEQAFSVSRADALHLGQLFMGEIPNPEGEFTPDHTDSLSELFRQFSGTVATQLKEELGKECVVRFKDAQEPAWESAETTAFVVSTDPHITIVSRIDAGLRSSLAKSQPLSSPPLSEYKDPGVGDVVPPSSDVSGASRQNVPVPPEPTIHSGTVYNSASRASIHDKNLDLLLDVPLEVSIRFGRRQMLLKDVLELSSGSMVELDRRVHDHIELVLGGRVIARGEAVIVDGSYGIRISEVLSPARRLAEIS